MNVRRATARRFTEGGQLGLEFCIICVGEGPPERGSDGEDGIDVSQREVTLAAPYPNHYQFRSVILLGWGLE